MSHRATAAALAFASASFLPAQAPTVSVTPVQETVTVSAVEVTLHVTDRQGRVVPDLKKEDFQLFVDNQPVPIDSVEWVTAVSAAMPSRTATLIRTDGPPPSPTPAPSPDSAGRLIVMVFQSHIEGQKDEGLMRMKRQALAFLDTLGPSDEVALLVFGSRLWLSQDFTTDRAVMRKAIQAAPRKEETARVSDSPPPSIGAHLTLEEERSATSMEKGLAAIGRALRPLPGSKAILFFGYALGRWTALSGTPGDYSQGRFDTTRDLGDAERALAVAQAPVFSLDISAGSHQLEAGLKQLSFETGGFYMKTDTFPDWAMAAVREAVKGHYALTFTKPAGQPGPHRIRIDKMRGAAPWVLLYRQEYDDSLAPSGS